jgi:hypothetical protein
MRRIMPLASRAWQPAHFDIMSGSSTGIPRSVSVVDCAAATPVARNDKEQIDKDQIDKEQMRISENALRLFILSPKK